MRNKVLQVRILPTDKSIKQNRMKAKDFRIGNLAKDKLTNELLLCCGLECDTDGKNSNITFGVIDRSKYPLPDGWQAEPIPLTEEWLIKFGFETWSGLLTISTSKKRDSLMSVSPKDLSYGLYGSQHSFRVGYGHNSGIHRLNYVHQLQNLYFVLTDEELKLSE